jgi:hypothetical protein
VSDLGLCQATAPDTPAADLNRARESQDGALMPTIPDAPPADTADATVGGVLFALAELAGTVSQPRGHTEAAALARTLDGLASDLTTVAASLRASPAGKGSTTMPDQATVQERLRRVDALDLEPIVFKLMHPEPGEMALGLARADQDVALYRCFLKLCALHPGATIVPTRQLDRVWHTHMLDTAKYRADCDQVFGLFLDHFPYFGFRGDEDRRAWQQDFAHTRRLFRQHFGVEIGSQPAASACRNHGDGSDCCVGCIRPSDAGARPRPDRSTSVARVGPREEVRP